MVRHLNLLLRLLALLLHALTSYGLTGQLLSRTEAVVGVVLISLLAGLLHLVDAGLLVRGA